MKEQLTKEEQTQLFLHLTDILMNRSMEKDEREKFIKNYVKLYLETSRNVKSLADEMKAEYDDQTRKDRKLIDEYEAAYQEQEDMMEQQMYHYK